LLHNKLTLLATEVEKLNSLINEKNRDIEDWRLKYVQVESNYRAAQSSETRYASLHAEYTSLANLLREKVNEIDSLKRRNAELENQLALVVLENERLAQQLNHVDKDFEIWKSTNVDIINGRSAIHDLQSKLLGLSRENDDLQLLVQEKDREVDFLKARLLRTSGTEYINASTRVSQSLQPRNVLTSDVLRLSGSQHASPSRYHQSAYGSHYNNGYNINVSAAKDRDHVEIVDNTVESKQINQSSLVDHTNDNLQNSIAK